MHSMCRGHISKQCSILEEHLIIVKSETLYKKEGKDLEGLQRFKSCSIDNLLKSTSEESKTKEACSNDITHFTH